MPWFRLVPAALSSLLVAPVGAVSRSDLVRDDLATAALLTAVAGWIVFALLRGSWVGVRRDDGDADDADADDTLHLPDDPPPVVDTLVNRGTVRPEVIATVVLDLASRGYIGIVEQRRSGVLDRGDDASRSAVEWRLVRLDTPRGDLQPYENAVFTRLFASGNETTRDALAGWITANRQQARVFVERVQRAIGAEVQRRGYVEAGRRLPLLVNLSAGAVVLLLGLGALLNGAWAGVLAVGSGAGQIAVTRRLRRRTVTGADRIREWTAAARRLARIGESGREASTPTESDATEPDATESEPTEPDAEGTVGAERDARAERGVRVEGESVDAEVWERWLVYAAVLGVADEFAQGLIEHHPAVVRSDEFVRWFHATAGPEARLAGVGRFVEEFGRVFAGASGLDPVRELRQRTLR